MVNILKKLANGVSLNIDEAYLLSREILSGGLNDVAVAAALTAMRCRGETAEEVTGFVKSAREVAVKVPLRVEAIDTAGTGGDGAGTINLSTLAAVVAAAAGARVLKHGNRSASGFFGSADFMEAVGYNLEVGPEKAAEMVEKIGFAFVFAPRYHPAFAKVAPVRRQLPFRTVFNIVGPLANPGLVKRQLIGVSERRLLDVVGGVASVLLDRALVVYGSGVDEVSTEGPTEVVEVRGGRAERYVLEPEDFGIGKTPLPRASTREEAVGLALAGLRGEHREAEIAIAVNAAAALYVAEVVRDFRDGFELAVKTIREGAAYRKLREAVEASR
ncbi:anthranilate phosphoribosyltransferase [Pyrobaculum islandicum DSM 4184]|uniref:Anthranilate phosphoribosyltransferase n=1 Tax=Pyrobaculum islandicum (strain DSM 4184 / JCM 9189 / GEO3) TaxID=384616 RepID=TRPD_PYRIL|nr:anthranilate phosphoribosyltransferase [Pyrobaculum islandicum]A1RVT0.1 RecName: Full=Anthranilate phosphoribosyltransferase [Pyrobaculum islandicum DSM 4184]ABL89062.1 anthranilate phosphoribosyltransferase [Pyrobaculum islandicum DSM 4184]